MSKFFNVNFLICRISCLLGLKSDIDAGATVQRLWTVDCLSMKRLIPLNWRERQPACLSRDSWLKEHQDLLNMEMAACLLKDFEKSLTDHWDIIAKFLNKQC